jgi:hypothetical protein
MLSISFLDLAHNALNSIGFLKGNLWVSHAFRIIAESMLMWCWSVSDNKEQLSVLCRSSFLWFSGQVYSRARLFTKSWSERETGRNEQPSVFLSGAPYQSVFLTKIGTWIEFNFLCWVWGHQADDGGKGKDMMRKHRRQVLFSGIITAVGKKLGILLNH